MNSPGSLGGRLMQDIQPRGFAEGLLLSGEDDIRRCVEEPLQQPVIELLHKNIRTTQTSANRHDALSGRRAFITLDRAALSPENRITLALLGTQAWVGDSQGQELFRGRGLELSLTPTTKAEDVEEAFLGLTSVFVAQEVWRAQPVSFSQARQILQARGEEEVERSHAALTVSGLWYDRDRGIPLYYVKAPE